MTDSDLPERITDALATVQLTVADSLAVDSALCDAFIVASTADNPGAELLLGLADHAEALLFDGHEDAAEALHLVAFTYRCHRVRERLVADAITDLDVWLDALPTSAAEYG